MKILPWPPGATPARPPGATPGTPAAFPAAPPAAAPRPGPPPRPPPPPPPTPRPRPRRLDPPAGIVLRHHRHQAHLRPRIALRHDRLCLQPRPGRPDGTLGPGL